MELWRDRVFGTYAFRQEPVSSNPRVQGIATDADGLPLPKQTVRLMSNWSVAYAGEWTWKKLNNKIGSDMSKLVFADFNGKGMCDIAINNESDGKWYISYGGREPWTVLNESADGNHSTTPDQLHLYALESMLIRDFDGDGHADALHYERYQGEDLRHRGPDGKPKKTLNTGCGLPCLSRVPARSPCGQRRI